jgi:hypothetical protein
MTPITMRILGAGLLTSVLATAPPVLAVPLDCAPAGASCERAETYYAVAMAQLQGAEYRNAYGNFCKAYGHLQHANR